MYIRIAWPDSQILMNLTDGDLEDYGIELGADCSYYIDEDYYDEVMALAGERELERMEEERGKEKPWDYGEHF